MRQLRSAIAMTVSTVTAVTCAAAVAAGAPVLPSHDPFYSYNGALARIYPGTVLKQRTVVVAEGGNATPLRATQLLYRTTGELGQPTVTVATVFRPLTQPLLTRIVSYQTAYDGLGSQCDPSYTLQGGNASYSTAQAEEQVILGYLAQGDTVVVPDYEGEQLDWGAGQESGYGTLDGIRAAENFLAAPLTRTRVAMIGYSGGSIATDFAGELAPSYAPHLNIVGVAEGGLPVDFLHNLAYVNGSPSWSGVIPAVVVSLGRAFGVSLTQFLSPYGIQVTNQVKDECINSFVGHYPGLTIQKLLRPGFRNVLALPSIVQIADHVIMSRTGTPRGPMFIGVGNKDGTGDGIMVARDVEALAHTYCERGVPVQFSEYPGQDHTGAGVAFEVGAALFVAERLAGLPVKSECGTFSAGNSLAPYPSPKSTPGLHVKDLGTVRHRHRLALVLRSTAETWPDLVVALERGHRRIAETRIPRLAGRRRIVLRPRDGSQLRGRYLLTIDQGFVTLTEQVVQIR